MRICIIANAGAVHTKRWAGAYVERGHEVHVLSIRRAPIAGVTVHTVALGPENSPSRSWSFLSYLRLLLSIRRLLNAIAPDVVHAHYVTTNGYFASHSGRPYLLTAWGSDVIPADGTSLGFVQRTLAHRALTRATVVTSASRYMAGWIERIAPTVDPEIVPFGVDTEAFHPDADPDPERSSDQLTIGVVKSLERRYGVDDALRAMTEVLVSDGNAVLVIAGGGRLRPDLEALAGELGIADSVRFLGPVPHESVPDLMRNLDVLVNPTVVPESFGVVILEAEATAVPVVATDVGGVREVCIAEETALLYPAGDSGALAQRLGMLAADGELRMAMGRRGRRHAESFPWHGAVDHMLEMLSRVAEQR